MTDASTAFHARMSGALSRLANVVGVEIVYHDGGSELAAFQAGPPRYSTAMETMLSQFDAGAVLTVDLDIPSTSVAAPEIGTDWFELAGLEWEIRETVLLPSGWHHLTARAVRKTFRGREARIRP